MPTTFFHIAQNGLLPSIDNKAGTSLTLSGLLRICWNALGIHYVQYKRANKKLKSVVTASTATSKMSYDTVKLHYKISTVCTGTG